MLNEMGPPGSTPTQAQLRAAALEAMESPDFYNVALANFVKPWTNVERTVFVDMNDYVATVIGSIRDGHPFDQVLTADRVYIAAPGMVPTDYAIDSNQHYREIEMMGLDLSNDTVLVERTQSFFHPEMNPEDTAGVTTTRAAAEAFFSAGTNRRMWRFTSLNYLCRDLEEMKDTNRAADRVRQDVSRSPGGDSAIFHTQCVGCHAGQDALAGAYAYFEWAPDEGLEGRMMHTRGQVQGKYAINTGVFPGGHITVDNSWQNLWRSGGNAALGWSDSELGSGLGMKTLGAEVAHSRAFAVCQVQKVFEHVCFRPAQVEADATAIESIADTFEQGYDMLGVFADVAVHCTEGE
ncbi:MAG: hypothetical protein AAF430_00575 [Myxococcota bacterium]